MVVAYMQVDGGDGKSGSHSDRALHPRACGAARLSRLFSNELGRKRATFWLAELGLRLDHPDSRGFDERKHHVISCKDGEVSDLHSSVNTAIPDRIHCGLVPGQCGVLQRRRIENIPSGHQMIKRAVEMAAPVPPLPCPITPSKRGERSLRASKREDDADRRRAAQLWRPHYLVSISDNSAQREGGRGGLRRDERAQCRSVWARVAGFRGDPRPT